jgi:hypothetical protein
MATPTDQNPCAYSRKAMDVMRHGWSVGRFQWWQQWSTMWPVAVFDSIMIAARPVREPVLAHELPDVIHHVALEGIWPWPTLVSGGSGKSVMSSDTATSPQRCEPA